MAAEGRKNKTKAVSEDLKVQNTDSRVCGADWTATCSKSFGEISGQSTYVIIIAASVGALLGVTKGWSYVGYNSDMACNTTDTV